jgi:hypothetical protein
MKREERKEKRAERKEKRGTRGQGFIPFLISHSSFLIFLLVFAACPNNGELSQQQEQSKLDLPDGYGSFTLKMPQTVGRTIAPASPQWGSFASFGLVVVPVSGEALNETDLSRNLRLDSGQTYKPELFYPGFYNITVNAKNTAGDVLARGTKPNVEIKEGENTNETVTLAAIIFDANLDGTFTWDITLSSFPAVINKALMTILDASEVQQGATVDLKPSGNTNAAGRSLPSGVYTVKFEFEGVDTTGPDDKPLAFTWYELLHVYANLTSDFTHDFKGSDFHRTHWNVTLHYENDGLNAADYAAYKVNLGTGKQSVIHGGTLTATGTNPNDVIPVPAFPRFQFGGWFDNAAGTGTAWTITDKVHEDWNLWAKWIPNQLIITLALDDIIAGKDPTHNAAAPLTLSRSGQTPYNKTATINVTNTTGITNYKWEVENVGVYATPTPMTLSEGATQSSFILDVGAPMFNYSTFGGHNLRLTITRKLGTNDIDYRINIPFTVVE